MLRLRWHLRKTTRVSSILSINWPTQEISFQFLVSFMSNRLSFFINVFIETSFSFVSSFFLAQYLKSTRGHTVYRDMTSCWGLLISWMTNATAGGSYYWHHRFGWRGHHLRAMARYKRVFTGSNDFFLIILELSSNRKWIKCTSPAIRALHLWIIVWR